MARIQRLSVPRQKPKDLHTFLRMAVRALFPSNNERRLARAFELLIDGRSVDDGWVARSALAKLWPEPGVNSGDGGRRKSGAVTNGLDELMGHVHTRLAWVVPHMIFELERNPPRRAIRYRLNIRPRGPIWDFDEKDHSSGSRKVAYRFRSGRVRHIEAVLWGGGIGQRLAVEAVREPPDGQWEPPSHAKYYEKARDSFFEAESAKRRAAGTDELHRGELWGIKGVDNVHGTKETVVRIITTRTSYADYLFLRSHLDRTFSALSKEKSFREWLGLHPGARDTFCAPRDALCVVVALVTKDPKPTVFVAKQKAQGIQRHGIWDLSAAGAASSTLLHTPEERPDLLAQVQSVTFRETGIKFEKHAIQWLGFARTDMNSSVIAVVELPSAVDDILKKFKGRRERDDVEELCPVAIESTDNWLEQVAPADRCEFLELGLVLVGEKYGFAKRE